MEKQEISPALVAYLEEGFGLIKSRNNAGLLNAFPNASSNKKIFLTLKDFKAVLVQHKITAMWNTLPPEFFLTIKYSPISRFKRWIFQVSNQELLKVSEKKKLRQREYFLLFLDGELSLYVITTNIAHERFLLELYLSEFMEKKNLFFHTYFSKEKKLAIYKDYRNRKVSSIAGRSNLVAGKYYPIKASVTKTKTLLQLHLLINNSLPLSCSVKLSKKNRANPEEGDSDLELRKARLKVIEILEENHDTNKEVNKFANISLGRVYRVPILVNLPRKEAGKTVNLQFDAEKNQLVVREVKDDAVQASPLKIFKLTLHPRSNWLSRF